MPLDLGPISSQSPEFAPILAGIAMGAVERERDGLSASGAFDLIRRCRLGAIRLDGDSGLRDLISVVIGLGNADPAIALVLVDHFLFVERCLRPCRSAAGANWSRSVRHGALFRLVDFDTDDNGAARSDLDVVPTLEGRCHRIDGFTAAAIERNTNFLAVAIRLPDRSRAWAIVPNEAAEDCETGLFVPTRDLIPAGDPAHAEEYSGPGLRQLMLAAVSAGIAKAIRRDAAHAALVLGGSAGQLQAHAAAQIAGEIAADATAGEATVLAAADTLEHLPACAIGPSAIPAAAHQVEQAWSAVDRLTRRSARRLFDLCKAAGTLSDLDPERHERHACALSPTAAAYGSAGMAGALPLEPVRSVLFSTL
jgi:hypothetical protein